MATRAPATGQAHDWTCPTCGQRFVNKDQQHSCDLQTIDSFFAADPAHKPLYTHLRRFLASLGPIEVAASKTQISFRSRVRFAFLWFPYRARGGGKHDLFLTFTLRRRERSPRVKESVNPRGDFWTHHLLFRRTSDLDTELKGWLTEAYTTANARPTRRNVA